eukprot:815998-Rhodomonas_salina.1
MAAGAYRYQTLTPRYCPTVCSYASSVLPCCMLLRLSGTDLRGGTELGYGAMRRRTALLRCPVLTGATGLPYCMLLRACYAMPGTDLCVGGTVGGAHTPLYRCRLRLRPVLRSSTDAEPQYKCYASVLRITSTAIQTRTDVAVSCYAQRGIGARGWYKSDDYAQLHAPQRVLPSLPAYARPMPSPVGQYCMILRQYCITGSTV